LQKGPNYLFTTLKIKSDKNSYFSYDAWDYICNYSMYIILNSFKNKRFTFIHIPKNYNINTIIKYIEKILKKEKRLMPLKQSISKSQ